MKVYSGLSFGDYTEFGHRNDCYLFGYDAVTRKVRFRKQANRDFIHWTWLGGRMCGSLSVTGRIDLKQNLMSVLVTNHNNSLYGYTKLRVWVVACIEAIKMKFGDNVREIYVFDDTEAESFVDWIRDYEANTNKYANDVCLQNVSNS